MRTLLIFCYFLILLLVFSCGEATTDKKSTPEKERQETTKTSEKKDTTSTIVFFGNSLTAGMGLDPDDAFPAILQKKLDSLNKNYTVVNAGLSGETTSSGKSRVSWILKQDLSVFVLELGANDGLRGIPLDETKNNLQAIIDSVRKKDPDIQIILAGMQIPPNMGESYTSEFRDIFPELAEKNNIPLIPFLLEGVAGNPDLNQKDGIHPTEEGQKIVAENVWETLQNVL